LFLKETKVLICLRMKEKESKEEGYGVMVVAV